MKNTYVAYIMLALMLCLMPLFLVAQSGPLRGSGAMLQPIYDFQNFDKINFLDLADASIRVEIGKKWSIDIQIPENLLPLLKVEKMDDENLLTVALQGNKNNKLYIENSKIAIVITLPEASVVSSSGNQRVFIGGIVGRYFRAESNGNGDITLQGVIDELDIDQAGNGNVHARQLEAKVAKVKKAGNGNIYVNSQLSLQANGRGNGNVVQLGPGTIHPLSGIIGNGKVFKK